MSKKGETYIRKYKTIQPTYQVVHVLSDPYYDHEHPQTCDNDTGNRVKVKLFQLPARPSHSAVRINTSDEFCDFEEKESKYSGYIHHISNSDPSVRHYFIISILENGVNFR